MVAYHQHSTNLPAISVLLYHKIAEVATDPWGIAVLPQNFEDQVHYLSQHCKVIGVDELVSQVRMGVIEHNAICISFDDGYADNYMVAKPILERFECPAMFFIATGYTGNDINFWWEDLEAIFLRQPNLPGKLSLIFDEGVISYEIPGTSMTAQEQHLHAGWKWWQQPSTPRCSVFLDIWQKLRVLPAQEIAKQLSAIKSWAGNVNNAQFPSLAMNEAQVKDLAKQSLFSIGIHTETHLDLKGEPLPIQLTEIQAAKRKLANLYGLDCGFISYPYGRYDENTIQAFDDLQLEAGFTTEAACVVGNSRLSTLGRFQVFNDSLESFRSYFQI